MAQSLELDRHPWALWPCFEKAWSACASNLICFVTLAKSRIPLSLNCLTLATSWRSEKFELDQLSRGWALKAQVGREAGRLRQLLHLCTAAAQSPLLLGMCTLASAATGHLC